MNEPPITPPIQAAEAANEPSAVGPEFMTVRPEEFERFVDLMLSFIQYRQADGMKIADIVSLSLYVLGWVAAQQNYPVDLDAPLRESCPPLADGYERFGGRKGG